MLDYNFRCRSGADDTCFGRGKTADTLDFDRFSLPPKTEKGNEKFAMIARPPVPELDDFVERYIEQY